PDNNASPASGNSGLPQVNGNPGLPQVNGNPGLPQVNGNSGLPQVNGNSGLPQVNGNSGLASNFFTPGTNLFNPTDIVSKFMNAAQGSQGNGVH
ncbi:MAG TPA: hypothetical protein VN704_05015, partial [Verrucomicrobiae bacterium]|nr:hypothetical protein [Verrucomicrobiae bacterium]